MFTGIITETGKVRQLIRHGTQAQLEVEAPLSAPRLGVGDSVAVCGVCLTVTSLQAPMFSADISSETLKLTTLGGKRPGEVVNLELALTPSGFLGGHIVSGHVEGVGTLLRVREQGQNATMRFKAPVDILQSSIPRGSIAVEGVSLTITDMDSSSFEVVLIPHTLSATNLGNLRPGSKVNLEADLIGRYVIKALRELGAI